MVAPAHTLAPWSCNALAAEATLKISHQFPSATATEGDFRTALAGLRFCRPTSRSQQRALKGRGLSGLVADEDELAVLGDA